jgi:hypothetical protein
VNGKRTGKGVYISASGDRYEGMFNAGKRTGQGIFISAEGAKNELKYKKGKLVK